MVLERVQNGQVERRGKIKVGRGGWLWNRVLVDLDEEEFDCQPQEDHYYCTAADATLRIAEIKVRNETYCAPTFERVPTGGSCTPQAQTQSVKMTVVPEPH